MIRKYLPKSDFFRHVLTLMSGTSLAMAVPILTSPILTRLYLPEDFGTFALFNSIATILGVAATGRYELAIMLPEGEEEAINVVGLTILCTVLISLSIVLVIVVFQRPLNSVINNPLLAPWLYFIPLLVLLIGTYQALYYWCNRKLQYKRLAVYTVLASLSMATTRVVLGFAGFTNSGLIVGSIFGQFLATGLLGWLIWREDRTIISRISIGKIKEQARKHLSFPKFSIAADLLNVVANQTPVVFLSMFFGSKVVGYFALTQRVLSAPLTVISNAVSNVFRQRASQDYVEQGNCRDIYQKTFKGLVILSAVPSILLFLLAPKIFVTVFGPNWETAGVYAQIMALFFFVRFFASPLGYIFYIAGKQRVDLIWQGGLLFLTILAMLIGYHYQQAIYSIILYSAFYTVMYLIYTSLSYRFAQGR